MTGVDVWWSVPHSSAAFLDPVEEARRDALVHAADRDRFVTGRSLLRRLVGSRLGVAPESVVLDATCPRCGAAHGRPQVVGTARPVFVSVAHAGDRVLVAAGDHPVGVDVEPVAATGFTGFDGVALTARERTLVSAAAPAERPALRAELWVRKEAALKLTGAGLGDAPEHIEHDAGGTRFLSLDVGWAYRAALAVPAGVDVRQTTWQSPAIADELNVCLSYLQPGGKIRL